MAPQTCGTGLADHAVLPARIGEFVAALADVLDNHLRALDDTDDDTGPERVVYARLVGQGREIAASLHRTASEMAAQRDLPMGRHLEEVMASASTSLTFERYVDAEQALLTLLGELAAQDRTMLDDMRGAAARDR